MPWEHGLRLAETNLAAMWRTYQASGYSRLIYTNTVAVRTDVIDSLLAALGGDPVVHAVLLRASTPTVTARLAQREIGSALERHVRRSRRAARELEDGAPAWVRRLSTDGHGVTEIAEDIRTTLGWLPLSEDL